MVCVETGDMSTPGRNKFDIVATPDWNPDTVRACTRLYHMYVEPGTGAWVPDAAFCSFRSSLGDLPRWVFLEYLTRHCGVVLFGSNDPGLTRLEPIVLAPSVRGLDTPRYFGFVDSMRPIYQAIVDLSRLQRKNQLAQVAIAQIGKESSRFYFGLDYRALPQAPWRRGTMYLYARTDLPPGFDLPDSSVRAAVAPQLIRPLAKLAVAPWDWPLLGRVHGFDVEAHQARARNQSENFPWVADAAVHPTHAWRPLVEEVRAYLETHFAEKLSLETLGRQAGISAFALLRAFRAATGQSPHEYQLQLRVSRARHLLRAGGTIAAVATEVGFYDQSHFHHAFRRIVGLTPGGYTNLSP